jgi:hypothetical protein
MPFDKIKAPSTTEGLRVDTERRFLPRFENRGLAPSNVSILRDSGIKTPAGETLAGSLEVSFDLFYPFLRPDTRNEADDFQRMTKLILANEDFW